MWMQRMEGKVLLSSRILFWLPINKDQQKAFRWLRGRDKGTNSDGNIKCIRSGRRNENATKKDVDKDLPEKIKMACWEMVRKVKWVHEMWPCAMEMEIEMFCKCSSNEAGDISKRPLFRRRKRTNDKVPER